PPWPQVWEQALRPPSAARLSCRASSRSSCPAWTAPLSGGRIDCALPQCRPLDLKARGGNPLRFHLPLDPQQDVLEGGLFKAGNVVEHGMVEFAEDALQHVLQSAQVHHPAIGGGFRPRHAGGYDKAVPVHLAVVLGAFFGVDVVARLEARRCADLKHPKSTTGNPGSPAPSAPCGRPRPRRRGIRRACQSAQPPPAPLCGSGRGPEYRRKALPAGCSAWPPPASERPRGQNHSREPQLNCRRPTEGP